METEVKINAVEVKKELYKSKVNAKFMYFDKPNLFYSVELESGTYRFPIAVSTKKTLTIMDGEEVVSMFDIERAAPDLAGANFSTEVKASDLNRWIERAIKNDDFIKIG